MPQYEWQRDEPFRDHANDRTVSDGEVVELSEERAADHPAFVPVEEPANEDANPGGDGDETGVQDADDADETTSDGPEEEVCGTEMTDGSLCQRPAGECPYHD